MTLNDIIDQVTSNPTIIVILLLSLVQITPIKINPWTSLVVWIGNIITQPVQDELKGVGNKLDNVEKDLSEFKKEQEEKDANDTRRFVFDFANACRNGRLHTRKQWNFVLTQIDEYEDYVEKKGIKNGVFKGEDEYLRERYKSRLVKNDFLLEDDYD